MHFNVHLLKHGAHENVKRWSLHVCWHFCLAGSQLETVQDNVAIQHSRAERKIFSLNWGGEVWASGQAFLNSWASTQPPLPHTPSLPSHLDNDMGKDDIIKTSSLFSNFAIDYSSNSCGLFIIALFFVVKSQFFPTE